MKLAVNFDINEQFNVNEPETAITIVSRTRDPEAFRLISAAIKTFVLNVAGGDKALSAYHDPMDRSARAASPPSRPADPGFHDPNERPSAGQDVPQKQSPPEDIVAELRNRVPRTHSNYYALAARAAAEIERLRLVEPPPPLIGSDERATVHSVSAPAGQVGGGAADGVARFLAAGV